MSKKSKSAIKNKLITEDNVVVLVGESEDEKVNDVVSLVEAKPETENSVTLSENGAGTGTVVSLAGEEGSQISVNTEEIDLAKEEERIEKLEEALENTNRELSELQSRENHLQNEDLMVQEKHWMEERTRKERESEDMVRRELFEKQNLIEQMRREQAEKFVQNKQMTLYNQLHEQEQREQIYALHGITTDKVEGMMEYKNAVYQGAVFSMFMMALALCAYIGYIEGVDTRIFFAMLALTGAESTVLLHERDGKLQSGLYGAVCKLFGILTTPVMLFLYTVYELEFIDMSLTLWGCAAYAILMYLLGSADFFLRNPYRGTGRAARESRMEMRDLKRTAAKNVKKNQKVREKMEARLIKKREAQERKLEELKLREKQKAEKLTKKLELQRQKQAEYETVAAIRRENREKKNQLRNEKVVAIRTRIADWTNRKNA